MPASEAVDGSSAGTGVPRKWALLKPYAAAKQFRFAALHESGHGPGRVKIVRQARTVRVATTPFVAHRAFDNNLAEWTSLQPQRRPEAFDRR